MAVRKEKESIVYFWKIDDRLPQADLVEGTQTRLLSEDAWKKKQNVVIPDLFLQKDNLLPQRRGPDRRRNSRRKESPPSGTKRIGLLC